MMVKGLGAETATICLLPKRFDTTKTHRRLSPGSHMGNIPGLFVQLMDSKLGKRHCLGESISIT
jgi:hypothetical protein